MNVTELVDEIHRAEKIIEENEKYYWYRESEAPAELKLIMLINNYYSPCILIEELLKVIYTNERLLKKYKVKFNDIGYKSRYMELERIVQERKNNVRRG